MIKSLKRLHDKVYQFFGVMLRFDNVITDFCEYNEQYDIAIVLFYQDTVPMYGIIQNGIDTVYHEDFTKIKSLYNDIIEDKILELDKSILDNRLSTMFHDTFENRLEFAV